MKLASRFMRRTRKGIGWGASRGVLSLFLSGVTAIAAPAPDTCSKAPFQGVPPSQREWSLLAVESDQFRARLVTSNRWLHFKDPVTNADGLRARGGEGWKSGSLAYSESLVVRWEDVERLECNRGSHSGAGVLLGAAAGGVAFVGLHDESWWSVLWIPVGMVIGGIIGASQPIWRAVYCSEPANQNNGGEWESLR
jgi:hypothetical protein